MDGGGLDAAFTQVAHLVFHERYERGDDQADAIHCHCGNLERYALAASGRHESQSVTSLADTLYDLLLDTAETVISPVGLEYLQVIHRAVRL